MKFKNIRVEALSYWFENSKRSRGAKSLSDCYSETFLCKLQGDDFHISFLCSLAEWLNNITDILTDDRFDECDVRNELLLDSENIFRFYTRLLLVVSEIIEDFIDLHSKLKAIRNKRVAGQDFAIGLSLEYNLKDISNYINSVCKHKVSGLHCHNHHLNIEFEDFGGVLKENQIKLGHSNPEKTDDDTTILVPRLQYFIEAIISCCSNLEKLLEDPVYYEKLKTNFVR